MFADVDTTTMIIILASLGGFASVLAVAMPFLRGDQRDQRVKMVAKRREELSAQQREQLAQKRASRRPQAHVTAMKRVLEKINLQNLLASKELKDKLAAAGYRQQSAPTFFVIACIGAAVTFALFALIFLSVSEKFNYPVMGRIAIAAAVGAAGFYLPTLLVKSTAEKRQQAMAGGFPEALDLLVICVEAGLSIEAAFGRVTEEIQDGSAILAQEFGLLTAELAFLGDRRSAYTNFAERTGLPAARSLTTALIQSEKYGTPVSVALKILSQENREARMAMAEKKAGALPAQLTVPMIVFFLPPLMVVIIGSPMIVVVQMW